MKKVIIFAVALICSVVVFAQEKSKQYSLKAINAGLGVPMEFRDLHAAGLDIHLGYDCAYPLNDQLAIGFYVNGTGGFIGELANTTQDVDKFHTMIKVSTGLMLEIGDLAQRPYLVGVAPCTGIGYYDMDLVLPIEIRFGRFITDNLYVMGELTYGISLAKETACLEPAIRIGYNFRNDKRSHKK